MKNYRLTSQGLFTKPRNHLLGSWFLAHMDHKARRPQAEEAYSGSDHDQLRHLHRAIGQNHPLLSRPGNDYIAMQQQGSGNSTGA
jgi:hypothetical protein